jgi:hypothetical protein
MQEQNTRKSQWVNFIGLFLILLGIYGSIRTLVNIGVFEKYPMDGVYPTIPFLQNPYAAPSYPTGGREEDCEVNYQPYSATTYLSYPVASPDGGTATKPWTKDQIESYNAQQLSYKNNCISGVKEARDKAKINDISQSLLFLFMGAGVLLARKIFK